MKSITKKNLVEIYNREKLFLNNEINPQNIYYNEQKTKFLNSN